MANIKFGTDGWRAIVGKDFTAENVEIVTNAIGKYVLEEFGIAKKIIIGYDPRNMAREFTQLSAEILSELGFEVIISDKVIATPVIAYGAKHLDACAIMFTASHNPPEYLGMKFIPDYAGPATNDITDKIVSNLGQKAQKQKDGSISEFDFKPAYFEHMKQLIDFECIKNLKTKIFFDGLYGSAIGYFDGLLDEYSIPYKALHMEFDPDFGGGMPEPTAKHLTELIELVKAIPDSIGLSNDGDADRFGIINEKGEWVSPNVVIAILLLYLRKYKNASGALVKTVSGSLMLNKLAEILNINVIETAVGFKNVGEVMRFHNPIIGGEESGGLSVQGHIPEKDGILANLLILEAMAKRGKSLVELEEEIHELIGLRFINQRVDLKLENQEQVSNALIVAKNIQNIGDLKVKNVDTKDGVKLYFDDDKSWILVRASGTEPLLRIYFESDTQEKLDGLKEGFII